MRIMLDTNVLISALLFPGVKMDAMMNYIFTHHQLVLSSYVVDELKRVVKQKFPGKEMATNKLLMMMSFEYVYTPSKVESGLFDIRDAKDYPVLYTAIIEDVDVLVTGDKDFSDIDVEKPEILSPSQFMEKFLTAIRNNSYKDSNGICPGQFLWRDGNNGIIQQRYTALDNFYFSSI